MSLQCGQGYPVTTCTLRIFLVFCKISEKQKTSRKLWRFLVGRPTGIGLASHPASRRARAGHRLAIPSGDGIKLRRSLPDRNHASGFFCPPTKNLQKTLEVFSGAANGDRTRNRGTTNPCDNHFTMAAMVPRVGLEPTTLRLEPSCSIQLSYRGLPFCLSATREYL